MQMEVGVIGALVGFLISYFGFMRSRDKDVKKDATEKAETSTKLNHIGSGVDSIRVKMEVSELRMSELSGNVIRVEESAKQAHKRIDGLEKESH